MRVSKECKIASFARLCNLFACSELTRQFSCITNMIKVGPAHVIVALFADLFQLMTSTGILKFFKLTNTLLKEAGIMASLENQADTGSDADPFPNVD